jgi:hypothetical protein
VWYKTGDRVLVPGTGTGVCQHRVVDPSPCRVLNMCVAGWRCAQLLCPSECWQGPGACARVCVCVPTAVVSLGTDLLPQSTLCSRMWGMPVLSLTGVRNTAPKVLFSSLFTTLISWAPAQVCRQGTAGARGGGGGAMPLGMCAPPEILHHGHKSQHQQTVCLLHSHTLLPLGRT